jgi:saccharopine dehydrogenase (NAD+, L-lysine-forming)
VSELKVAILGAGGTIAPAIVRDLAESEEVAELLLLDLDEGRAAAVAERHGGGKASARAADARLDSGDPRSLARALADADVLVNSASYRVNLVGMGASLGAGCHYVDLGGLYWMTGRQLELAPLFESAGLLAILGIGSAPGKTNLMASLAAGRLGADPDSIQVAAAGRDLDPPPGFSIPYALRTLVDELTMKPIVLRDGGPVEIEPLSDGGAIDFGDPIGEAETIQTLHSELRTFGESFRCRESSFRLSLAPELLEMLRVLAKAPEEMLDRAAREAIPPSSRTVSVHLVTVRGEGRAVRVRSLTEPAAHWGLGGGVISTAAPAAAAVRLLARGRVEARGVLPPERCLDPEDVFAELDRPNFHLEIAESASASPADRSGSLVQGVSK